MASHSKACWVNTNGIEGASGEDPLQPFHEVLARIKYNASLALDMAA